MTTHSDISTIVQPLLTQFKPQSVLLVGETANACFKSDNDTRTQRLSTPYEIEQLSEIAPIDLAIVSEITESLTKSEANQWLGLIRNYHASHLIVITDIAQTKPSQWQLTDFLALGMRRVGQTEQHHIYSYAIENYQKKREWLNSRFWANPENFDKYRW